MRSLSMQIRAIRLGWMPLPRWLLPVSEVNEQMQGGRFHFAVKGSLPGAGLAELRIAVHGIELLERMKWCRALCGAERRTPWPHPLAVDPSLEP